MNEHEVTGTPVETFFSWEDDGKGNKRPTLWDSPGEGRVRAVCLSGPGVVVEISTDPELVEAYLDD